MGHRDASSPQVRRDAHRQVRPRPTKTPRDAQGGGNARCGGTEGAGNALMRMGILTALAIAIHNFPEGIATFMPPSRTPLGVPIAVAHCRPQHPRGNRRLRADLLRHGKQEKGLPALLLSGLAEPVGPCLPTSSSCPPERHPFRRHLRRSGRDHGLHLRGPAPPLGAEIREHHVSIYGLIVGMMIMAVSLLLFI